MPSCYVTLRVCKDGPRFVVRYRVGGRETRLVHAGVFSSRAEADEFCDEIRTRLASAQRPREERPAPPKTRDLLVYFARLGPLVKIGVSVDPAKRARDLNAELVRVEPGGLPRERELHARFAHLRVSGEWFSDDPDLRRYITELALSPCLEVS